MSFSIARRIAFVGNHTPRQCGLATFTADICEAVANTGVQTQVVAINDGAEDYTYPDRVTFQIEQDNPASYQEAARFLNSQQLDLVCIQHEFGIYGGPAGVNLLILLRELNAPIVTTLHTVLKSPNPEQSSVLAELAQLSERLIVMTSMGKKILQNVCGLENASISVICHGIPFVDRTEPTAFLNRFGLEGKRVILTFGLLSPSKGIETMIRAMPAIVESHPDAFYLVLGATHPNIRRQSGESYRNSLIELCSELGIADNVSFVDKFVSMEDLTDYMHAASIYVTPYLNKEQVTSGTLARAFGSGKAVVSTPYWHAEELLAGGSGVLVPFRDPEAIAREINDLLSDPIRIRFVQDRAYEQGLRMIWPVVGWEYLTTFEEAIRSSKSLLPRYGSDDPVSREEEDLTRPEMVHLLTLTDDTGILQHCTYSIPNRNEGYCTDDNSRLALFGAYLDVDGGQNSLGQRLQRTALSFLHHAYNPRLGRMRNFMSFDRAWLDECGSEDCHGRALWALGVLCDLSSDASIRNASRELFLQAIAATSDFTSLRGNAFTILGLSGFLSGEYHRECLRRLDDIAERINYEFLKTSDHEWRWFEPKVTYDNARLPQALLTAGHLLGNEQMLRNAKDALGWLVRIQTDSSGCFLPIGSNGFFPKGGCRAKYDQQPVEASATVDACKEAFRITGDPTWKAEMHRAFNWFHGANTELKSLVDDHTGGCCDGLMQGAVNHNQGAESTLAYLSSTLQVIELELESLKSSNNGFLA